MSTKTNTTTTNQYNQAGMNAYNSLIPQFSSTISSLMNSPLNNSYFQNQLAMNQRSASQVDQRNISNTLANNRTGGGLLSGAGGFNTASLNNAMLSGSANQSGAFNSALGSALQNRNFALQSAEGFSPLQTGANTTQSKSGLGTWLPQVAGMGLQAALPGISSVLGGGSFGGGYSQPQQALSPLNLNTPSVLPRVAAGAINSGYNPFASTTTGPWTN